MKKLVLTTIAVVGVSSLAFAQGYVNWSTTPGASVIGNTNTINYSGLSAALGGGAATQQANAAQGVTQGGASSAASVYYYTLLYSTVDTTTPTTLTDLAANWSATGLMATNGATGNGRLNIANPAPINLVDPSYAGGNLNFMMVGWSANLGTAYSGVLTDLQNWLTVNGTVVGPAFFGDGAVGSLPISTSSSAGTTVIGAGLVYNPSSAPLVLNELQATPEPGTLALAALGGASLLLFRRKK